MVKLLTVLVLTLLTLFSGSGCSRDNFNRKIMLVTQSPAFNDNGYNYGLWSGVAHYRLQTEVEFLANPDHKTLTEVIQQAVKKKPGLLFISSDENDNQGLEPIVQQYPEIMFVLLDKRGNFTRSNFWPVHVQSNEGAFEAGYLAALMSKSHKLGFIGGVTSETIDRFKYGYLAGAAYAGKERQSKVEVEVRMAESYVDQALGEQLAKSLYADGCDIIFTAAGETGLGAIAEATRQNKYIIGVDVDQQNLAPDNILCSALSSYEVLIRDIINTYLKREKLHFLVSTGLAVGATGLAVNERLVPYNVSQAVRRVEELIKAGLQVPDSEKSYQLFLTNLTQD